MLWLWARRPWLALGKQAELVPARRYHQLHHRLPQRGNLIPSCHILNLSYYASRRSPRRVLACREKTRSELFFINLTLNPIMLIYLAQEQSQASGQVWLQMTDDFCYFYMDSWFWWWEEHLVFFYRKGWVILHRWLDFSPMAVTWCPGHLNSQVGLPASCLFFVTGLSVHKITNSGSPTPNRKLPKQE